MAQLRLAPQKSRKRRTIKGGVRGVHRKNRVLCTVDFWHSGLFYEHLRPLATPCVIRDLHTNRSCNVSSVEPPVTQWKNTTFKRYCARKTADDGLIFVGDIALVLPIWVVCDWSVSVQQYWVQVSGCKCTGCKV